MGDNGFGGNGRVHVMCLTIHMNTDYYSNLYYISQNSLVFFK